MPYTWDDLDRGYYDPRLGTYVQTSRVDWGRTAPRAYAQSLPAELLRGYYDSDYGTYVTADDLNWRSMGRSLGLNAPSDVTLQGQSKRPFKAYWREPDYQPGSYAAWRYGTASPLAWRGGRALPAAGAAGGQPASAQGQGPSMYSGGQMDLAALEAAAQAQGYSGIYVDDSGKHPANAHDVSDDGLISYDEAGYQLDQWGNRAEGSFQIGGTRKGQSGYRRGAPKVDDFILPQSMPWVEPSQFGAAMWQAPSFPAW